MNIGSLIRGTALAAGLAIGCIGGADTLAAPGIGQPTPVGPFLDGAFPSLPPGATPGAVWTTQNAFANLTFVEPVRILEHPTLNKLVVASKDGQVRLFDDVPGATQSQLMLDLRGKLDTTTVGESGLAGLVFHPEFGVPGSPNRGYFYVWYRWSPAPGNKSAGSPGYNRLSRFTVPDGSLAADPNSELVLIQQFDRQMFHIGGAMHFDDEGFLYVSLGDEGNCCDRAISTQRLDFGLWSGVLRIDVDKDASRSHPIIRQPQNPAPPPSGWPNSFTQEYYIPNDNPFVDPSGGTLEEFYALGLRHPWTITPDEQTGNVWVADVGQNEREEIDLLLRAGNYQWAYREGTLPGLKPTPTNIIGIEHPPVWEYDHSLGVAVIGAGVYRGTRYPELVGKYLFSDFTGGQLWTLELIDDTVIVTQIAELPGGFNNGINAFLLTDDGRILMAKTSGGMDPGGTILELVPQGPVVDQPPQFLSQTGAFIDLETLTPHPGCVPYDLNVGFWSDNAEKSRHLCVPNDGNHDSPAEKVQFSAEGDWVFPIGTVMIKHFEMPMSDLNPNVKRRLETRFIVRAEDGSYYGVTYRWLPDGSDAELLLTGQNETLTIQTASGTRQQVYHYPSRLECLQCHNSNAGGILGANTRQLNRSILYPSTGVTANQLETLNHLGVFSPAIDPADIPSFLTATPTQSSGTLTSRARSYLDSNCGYCHRPGGVRGNFDARLITPLADQNLIGGPLVKNFGIPGEAVLVPGSLSQSILYVRASQTSSNGGMPPLSKNLVHGAGVALLADWIDYLAGFDVGNGTASDGPFIDAHHPSLYINESDTFSNEDSTPLEVHPSRFDFYARGPGNPLTPIVVKVNGNNDFTVVAVGTTRTAGEYGTGSNTFDFADSPTPAIVLQPGETLATGFMDSFPDGSGWGNGPVIPADSGAGNDEIWGLLPNPLILASSGFVASRDTPAVVVGQSPLVTNAGKALSQFNLNRSYRYAIGFTFAQGGSGGGSGNAPPVLEDPGPQSNTVGDSVTLPLTATDDDGDDLTFSASGLPSGLGIDPDSGIISGTVTSVGASNVTVTVSDGNGGFDEVSFGWTVTSVGGSLIPLVNGSFEQPSVNGKFAYFTGSQIPGWTVSSGDVDIIGTKYWAAPDGVQTLDLAGNGPGTLEKNITGLASGVVHEVVFAYARHSGGGGTTRSASVKVDGVEIGTVTTSQKPPNFTEGRFSFVAPSDGSVTLTFQATSPQKTGIVIDDVRLEAVGGGSGNTPPNVTSPGQQTGAVGENVILSITATDDDGDLLIFGAVGLPEGLAIDPGTGVISGTLTAAGTYDVTISVDDSNGGTDSVGFTWTVTDPSGNTPPVLTAPGPQIDTVGDSVELVLEANDTDGDILTFSATGLPDGLEIDAGTGVISGIVNVVAVSNVTVTVDDGNGGTDSVSFTWTVESAGGSQIPVANGSFEQPSVNGKFAYFTGNQIPGWTVTVGDVDIIGTNYWVPPEGVQSLDLAGTVPGRIEKSVSGLSAGVEYEVVFAYARHPGGGGTTRSARVLVNGTQVGTVTTSQAAPNFIEARLPFVAPSGGNVTLAFEATSTQKTGIVIDHVRIETLGGGSGNAAPVLSNPGPQTDAVGDTVSLTLDASDDDGDALTYAATGLPDGLAIGAATGTISGTLSAAGTFDVTASVNDGRGGSDSVDFTWTVAGTGGGTGDVANGSFELDPVSGSSLVTTVLTDWLVGGNVELLTSQVYKPPQGTKSLDLNGTTTGSIQQTVSGLSQSTLHTVYVSYADQRLRGGNPDLATADIQVNGTTVGTIRTTSNAPAFITCNGYEFVSDASGSATIRIASTLPGQYGIVVDDVRIEEGGLPAPPASPTLVNGGFEAPIGQGDPHLCGTQLPGWLVTQENVDIVDDSIWPPFEGENSLDLGGHGPGGIAQTVTGLVPGQTYTLSFAYARHQGWGSAPLTADVIVNGSVRASLVATTSNKPPNWLTASLPVQATANGTITVGFKSTSLTTGGGVIVDAIELE